MKVYAKKVIADGAERLALIKGLEEEFDRAYKALSKAKDAKEKAIQLGEMDNIKELNRNVNSLKTKCNSLERQIKTLKS